MARINILLKFQILDRPNQVKRIAGEYTVNYYYFYGHWSD